MYVSPYFKIRLYKQILSLCSDTRNENFVQGHTNTGKLYIKNVLTFWALLFAFRKVLC